MDSEVCEQSESVPLVSGIELAVVVPTFNERDNINPLLDRLEVALGSLSWEVIFVDDDSPDGTADLLREIAQQRPQSGSYTELAGVGCERLRRRRAVIIRAVFRGDRC